MIALGLFGAGRIGTVHARNIVGLDGARLVAVHDPEVERARALAEAWGCDLAPDAASLLARADIDAVVVAASSNSHAALMTAAAAAGKAIYCEKPIDSDLDRARDAVGAVEASGVPSMVGFHRRFAPQYRALRAEIEQGRVGRIKTISIVSREPDLPPLAYLRVAGGLFRDKAIHFFDLVRWLSGAEPTEVHVMAAVLGAPALHDLGDVDTAFIVLRLADGALCQIENARCSSYGYDERIEVFGSDGMIEAGRDGTPGLARFSAGATLHDGVAPTVQDRFGDGFLRCLGTFVDALAAGRPPRPSLRDGLKAQIVAEAASRSRETGLTVPIAD